MKTIERGLDRAFVDHFVPEHSRTSCSDDNLENGYYQIWVKKLKDVVVERKFRVAPRCTRCFLLRCLADGYIDPQIEVTVDIQINVIQPKFEVKELKEGEQ